MLKKEAQFIFEKKFDGNNIIQLKNGKIISYHTWNDYHFNVYNEKSFQKVYDIYLKEYINIYEMMKQYNKKKVEEKKENKEGNVEYFFYNRGPTNEQREKNSIKELKKDLIIIGRSNYLFEIKLYEKTYDCQIVKQFDEIILNVDVLSEKKIIAFTITNIILLEKETEEYIIKDKFLLKDDWILFKNSEGDFNQYYFSDILPNNRLLLNSYCFELRYGSGLPFAIAKDMVREYRYSKIIFIDLNNFVEITSCEKIDNDTKYIILENAIIIQSYENLIIYDINTLNIIKKIKAIKEYDFMYQLDKQNLIAISNDKKDNYLKIYKIENNDLIEFCNINCPLFKKIFEYHYYRMNNEKIFVLRDKKILITYEWQRLIFQIIEE